MKTRVDYDLSRIRPVFDASNYKDGIAVVAVGAIGSRVAHLLCDIGLGGRLGLYDPDVVESHNLASATYEAADIGERKVYACASSLGRKWGGDSGMAVAVNSIPGSVARRGQAAEPTVFTCLDSMKERRKVVGEALFLNGVTRWVYDARITATTIFAIGFDITDPRQYKQYIDELYDDPPPEQDTQMGGCNQKVSVASTASMAASLLVQLFMDNANGVPNTPNEVVVDLRNWTMEARRYARIGE